MKRLLLFFVVLLTASPNAVAAPSLLEQGRNAEVAENYQQAIELYRQAAEADPTDPEPSRALATLFSEKGLHDLALPVWRQVVERAPGEVSGWLALAQTWSYRDDNAQSVRALDGAHQRFPQSAEVTQALAWMLFKTEDFRRGIALVEGFIAEHGTDRSLEMTLGTLYSSLFDYGRSRVHYLKSIELARGDASEEKNFRSIAWYNLSLLEKSFYEFERADEAIRKSIEEEDRPAGSLAWGELYQGRRDFGEARRLYEKAVQADETPLARFDLARLLQQFGFVDEAEAQLTKVEQHKDDTWIYNYGVTKDKVRRDLHELRADIHRSRFHLVDFKPRSHLGDWIVWAWDKVREGALWWYHDQVWKSLLVKLSESSLAVRNSPDAWVGLTLAHRERPGLALKYLGLIRDHELPRNPKAKAAYLIEEGVIRRDAPLLQWALSQTQVPWENEDRERALATLIEIQRARHRSQEAARLLSELYLLNPGGLPLRGWALPVHLTLYGEVDGSPWRQAWEDYRNQTGWQATTEPRDGVLWSLDWQVLSQGASWSLRDPEGQSVRTGLVRVGERTPLEALADVYRGVHAPR